MSADRRPLTRREVLRIGAGVGAGLALGWIPLALRAAAASPDPPEAALLTKPIPSTGERIPVIGIGTARRYHVGSSEAERAPLREVLRAFARMGGSVIDTAPSYGTAESVVGDLVAGLGIRDRLFFATKVGSGGRGVEAGLAEMRQSLARLRTDALDLLQVHNLAGVDAMLPVLREWKREGRIRYLGVSTSFDRQHGALVALMEREELDFIQVDYAIDNRTAADRILPLAADRGIAVLTNLPFRRGRVLQAFGDRPVPEWAAELGIASWAQFALKYVVSHPAVTCAIPGTATLRYLEDNLGAARGPLPDEATRRRMAALVDAAPGRAR
ncbi:MAG: aldo/keto reductase [Candidatus Rokubacteria bacterium]|nr:aldo/keto reductase [Candidatus Rokubacteria bacterium]